MFLQASVCPQGEYLVRYCPHPRGANPPGSRPPGQVHPPGADPPDQVHPPGPGTPPGTRYTPSPWTRYTPIGPGTPSPGPGTPPLDQVHPPGTSTSPRGSGTSPKIWPCCGQYTSYWNAFLF